MLKERGQHNKHREAVNTQKDEERNKERCATGTQTTHTLISEFTIFLSRWLHY